MAAVRRCRFDRLLVERILILLQKTVATTDRRRMEKLLEDQQEQRQATAEYRPNAVSDAPTLLGLHVFCKMTTVVATAVAETINYHPKVDTGVEYRACSAI